MAVVRVPEDHATLEDAVMAAVSGDTIALGPGVHTTPSCSITQTDLSILGAGSETCTLDGGPLRLEPDSSGRIAGMTLHSDSGDNVKLVSCSWVIEDCVLIASSNCVWCGGESSNAHVVVRRCDISGREGKHVSWALFFYGKEGNRLELEDCNVFFASKAFTTHQTNEVTCTGGSIYKCGVAIAARAMSCVKLDGTHIHDCDFVAETSTDTCSVELMGCVLEDNSNLCRGKQHNLVVHDMPIKSASKLN